MSTPRAVVVTRATEYAELLARHGTRGQAAFFLQTRGRALDEVAARHTATEAACREVERAIPADWRRAQVEREELSRFVFGPDDVVVVLGQGSAGRARRPGRAAAPRSAPRRPRRRSRRAARRR